MPLSETVSTSKESRNSRRPIPTQVIRVPNIINPNPEREQRIIRTPRHRRRRFRHRRVKELVHLVGKGEHGGFVWLDEGGVDCCAAVGVVVCEEEGVVELDCGDVDPVDSSDGGVALCDDVGDEDEWES